MIKSVRTDIIIVGGGTAGSYAARLLAKRPDLEVLLLEKAFIKRSGCLAAGVNALNAVVKKDSDIQEHTDFIRNDFNQVVRVDLVHSMAQGLNRAARDLEAMGLPFMKDDQGEWVFRGKRSVKINGEHIKGVLVEGLGDLKNLKIMEQFVVYDLVVLKGRVVGVDGFSLKDQTFYRVYSKAVLITTGGAAGLYKPNAGGPYQHRMWYSPFNTGAGYGMGIRAGAEMTTFEMRFVALRLKGTIAPTGTIAQGLKTNQRNAMGDLYLKGKGPLRTEERLQLTNLENQAGRGPCYLMTKGMSQADEESLLKAYLNMAPLQTLKWLDEGSMPSYEDVEIEGTEPYVVGGHGASGYWVDTYRRANLPGLYAAGDVCGGSPKKYVTGCLAEANIAHMTILKDLDTRSFEEIATDPVQIPIYYGKDRNVDLQAIEEDMQEIMDLYAGGIGANYQVDTLGLDRAQAGIMKYLKTSKEWRVNTLEDLKYLYEVLDRLYIGALVIGHLKARKETRWPAYQCHTGYPERSDRYLCYVNSMWDTTREGPRIIKRPLVEKEGWYEHSDLSRSL